MEMVVTLIVEIYKIRSSIRVTMRDHVIDVRTRRVDLPSIHSPLSSHIMVASGSITVAGTQLFTSI